MLGHPLLPAALSRHHRAASPTLGGNIDRIVRTAAYPVTAIELTVAGADQQALREALADRRRPRLGVDVAGAARRSARARQRTSW